MLPCVLCSDGMHEGYDDADGLVTAEKLSRLRFGRDQRLQEVGRMLCSSVPVRMEIGTTAGATPPRLLDLHGLI